MESLCLMYHRIGRAQTDPWELFVSPEHFEEQVAWLSSAFDVTTFDRADPRASQDGRPSVCLSFDDGYEDNFSVALPILRKYNCPAIFFIPTLFLVKDQHFWWDVLEEIFLRSSVLPATLVLEAGGRISRFRFSAAPLSGESAKAIAGWKWYEDPPSERCAAFLEIWTLLKGLSHPEQEDHLAWLVRWCGLSLTSLRESRPMSPRGLQELAASPLARIGLHTHSHCDLSSRSIEEQWDELVLSRNTLREIAQVEPDLLAYPFGKFDDQTLALVKKMKLRACFTTESGTITPASDPHQLRRCQVGDWPVERLKEALGRWRECG